MSKLNVRATKLIYNTVFWDIHLKKYVQRFREEREDKGMENISTCRMM